MSKRAATSGNVWKQRFGWVRGKSVSRVHGRPENPSPVASRPGTGAKVWNGVETFPNGHGNKWKRVETTIRMGTGKVGKSCSRTPRKTTKTLSDSPETERKSGEKEKSEAPSGRQGNQRLGRER